MSYTSSTAGHYKGSLKFPDETGQIKTWYMILTLNDSGEWISHGYTDNTFTKFDNAFTTIGTYSSDGVITAIGDDSFHASISGEKIIMDGGIGSFTKFSSVDYSKNVIGEYRGKTDGKDIYCKLSVDESTYSMKSYTDNTYSTESDDFNYSGSSYIVGYDIVGFVRNESGDDYLLTATTTDNFESITIDDFYSSTLTKVRSSNPTEQEEPTSTVVEEEESSDSDLTSPVTVAHFASRLKRLKEASSEDAPVVKISVTDCTESNISVLYKALKVYEKTDSSGNPQPTILVDLDLTQSTGLTKIPCKTFFGGESAEYDWKLAAAALYKIELPESLTEIEYHAFWSCRLESVLIPKSLRKIWYGAFSNCQGLEEIVLPADIEYIDNAVFSWTRAKISFDQEATFDADKYRYFMTDYGALVSVCKWSGTEVLGYRLVEWNNISGDVIIPDNILQVGADALGGYYDVTSIKVPSTVESFGYQNLNKDCNTVLLKSVTLEAAEGKKWIWEDSSVDLSDSAAVAELFKNPDSFDFDQYSYYFCQVSEDYEKGTSLFVLKQSDMTNVKVHVRALYADITVTSSDGVLDNANHTYYSFWDDYEWLDDSDLESGGSVSYTIKLNDGYHFVVEVYGDEKYFTTTSINDAWKAGNGNPQGTLYQEVPYKYCTNFKAGSTYRVTVSRDSSASPTYKIIYKEILSE